MLALISTFAIQAQKGERGVSLSVVGNAINFEEFAGENNQQFGGYLALDFDFADRGRKLHIGPEFRAYSKVVDGGYNLYDASAHINLGYDFDKISIYGGVGYPFREYDYAQFIYSAQADIKLGKRFSGIINYNYYTNQKLFAYTSSIGAGVKYRF